MENWRVWDWTKFICCNRPLDSTFDFTNKPTDQLYSCLTNENSLSNLSANSPAELSFNNGLDNSNNNIQHQSSSNPSSPKQRQSNSLFEYNLSKLALLDNQQAQNYIQQQQNLNQLNENNQQDHQPPPLPPLPPQHLLKNNNYNYPYPSQYSNVSFNSLPVAPYYSNLNPQQYLPLNSQNTLYTDQQQSSISCISSSANEFNGQNSLHRNHLSQNQYNNFIHNSNSNMDGLRLQLARTKKNSYNAGNNNVSNNSTSSVQAAAHSLAGLVGNLNSSIRAPTIQRSAEMPVSLKGWLHRLEGAALKQWRRRWFVLGEYCLFYYKDVQEQKMIGSVLLPSYTVSACSQTDGITRKFAFKLEHHNTKTHYLAAECAESMHQWMTLISLSTTMQLNSSIYEQLNTDNCSNVSAALTATKLTRNQLDSQDMMNLILNRTLMSNSNNENNQNFANNLNESIDQNNTTEFNSNIHPCNISNNSNLINSVNVSTNGSLYQSKASSNSIQGIDNEDSSKQNESGSDCGFTNYKSRRASKTNSSQNLSFTDNQFNNQLDQLDQSAKYDYTNPGSSLPSNNFSVYSKYPDNNLISQTSLKPVIPGKAQHIFAPKRSHYVNAPPKPRRHQAQVAPSTSLDLEFDSYGIQNIYSTNQNIANQLNDTRLLNQANDLRQDLNETCCSPNLVNTQNYYLMSSNRNSCKMESNEDAVNSEICLVDNQTDNTQEIYTHYKRGGLKRQNASDLSHKSDIPFTNTRPKSSMERFDRNLHQQQFVVSCAAEQEQMQSTLPSSSYRPWSDFLQQAQRSQSTTPMSTQQNRLTSSLTAVGINSANNNPQLLNSTKQFNEHAKNYYNSGKISSLRSISPDYMNIEYFRQQQLNDNSCQNLMENLDMNLEQQESIYQRVLSKNARLEVEELENKLAKQRRMQSEKEFETCQQDTLQESVDKTDENELFMSPVFNIKDKCIQNKLNKEPETDNSDEFDLPPETFTRSQFRRSFMNAVYTQKSIVSASTYHANHAYCGPINNEIEEDLDSSTSNLSSQVDTQEQLTMQQRRDLLQKLLHSDSSDTSSNNKQYISNNKPVTKGILKTNKFKLTKDCLLNAESVRATPAIIMDTPDKNIACKQDLLESNEKVTKQLAFDLIEPVLAHKSPQSSEKYNDVSNSKLTKNFDVQKIEQHEDKINVKDRIKILENKTKENDSENSLNNLENDVFEKPLINKTRTRSSSLTLNNDQDYFEHKVQLDRSFSGQNLATLIEGLNKTSNNTVKNEVNNTLLQNYTTLKKKNNIKENENKSCTEKVKIHNSKEEEEEEDNGYLTMDSKLSPNHENEQNLVPEVKLETECLEVKSDENIDKFINTNERKFSLECPNRINFDEVFGATNDDENKNNENKNNEILQNSSDEIKIKQEPYLIEQKKSSEIILFEEDQRKTVEDQFAIYSGLDTIKRAPANFQNSRSFNNQQNKTSEFKLTYALTGQSTSKQINQHSNSSKLKVNSQVKDCAYKPQQIIASSLINRNSNLVFVSNPLMNPDMMDTNPAYESFDGVRYGANCLLSSNKREDSSSSNLTNTNSNSSKEVVFNDSEVNENEKYEIENKDNDEDNNENESKKENESENENLKINKDENKDENLDLCQEVNQQEKLKIKKNIDNQENSFLNSTLNLQPASGCSSAPYYYSDLLSEEQKIELSKKLNKADSKKSPPPLLSRCNAVNNAKYLETTNLQKNQNLNKVLPLEKLQTGQITENIKIEKLKQNDSSETINSILISQKSAGQYCFQDNLSANYIEDKKENISRKNMHISNLTVSNSLSVLCENYNDTDPVYENVKRFSAVRSQSSANLTNFQINTSEQRVNRNSLVSLNRLQLNKNPNLLLDQDLTNVLSKDLDGSNHDLNCSKNDESSSNTSINNLILNKESSINIQSYNLNELGCDLNLNCQLLTNNDQTTPITKSNNLTKSKNSASKNLPTISGYSNSIENEQNILINEDYNLNKNINYENDLCSNLNEKIILNKFNPDQDLVNSYVENQKSIPYTTSSSSVSPMSVQSGLNINSNLSSHYLQQNFYNHKLINESNSAFKTTPFIHNHHGHNLNLNIEKNLSNKHLLNDRSPVSKSTNLNNLSNLKNTYNNNSSLYQNKDYVVYENASVEKAHLLILQQQLHQQQQLLLKQQQQLKQLQAQQKLKNYIYNNLPEKTDIQPPFDLACSSMQAEENSLYQAIDENNPNNKNNNYHNYQNVFPVSPQTLNNNFT